jgi:hypothetical protein
VCLLGAATGEERSGGAGATPQRLAEDQIKAGFLFNFTRFVEWNQSALPFSPFLLCIVDDPAIADLLSEAAAGKIVNGRTVSIRQAKPAEDFKSCNVLFVGDTSERRAGQILDGLKRANVLTVGEAPGFTEAGGMFNFVNQDNQVKLELNLEAAKRGGLKISAKLIAVSRVVAGDAQTSTGGGR